MKFEKTEVFNFAGALRGMRNPLESWEKSDSFWDWENTPPKTFPQYIIGENDMKLAQKLIRAGSSHRKFLRQIFVCVDVTAPMYWFSEFDTYKVGTVANSTSKMHKLSATEITPDCFELDDYSGFDDDAEMEKEHEEFTDKLRKWLENLRQKFLKTKNKKYWKALIRWLPESWLQKRTVTMSYETVLKMINERKTHKLNEWSGIDNKSKSHFIEWAKSLPYAKELLFIDEVGD